MKHRNYLRWLVLFVFVSGLVWAENQWYIQAPAAYYVTSNPNGYDPISPLPNREGFDIGVQYKISEDTPYFMTVSRGGNANYDRQFSLDTAENIQKGLQNLSQLRGERVATFGKHALPYQLFQSLDNFLPLQDFYDFQHEAEVISGQARHNTIFSSDHNLFIVIQPGLLVPHGTYRDVITLSLYEGSPRNPFSASLVDQNQIKLHIPVAPVLDLAIDFENPIMTSTHVLYKARVRSNQPYRFHVSASTVEKDDNAIDALINGELLSLTKNKQLLWENELEIDDHYFTIGFEISKANDIKRLNWTFEPLE